MHSLVAALPPRPGWGMGNVWSLGEGVVLEVNI